jgi:hypothetical protein
MNMGFDASGYTGANYFTGKELQGRRIEFGVVGAYLQEFEGEETKPVIVSDYQGKKLVLNKTRTKQVVAAWGIRSERWIGQRAVVFGTTTPYEGRMEPAVGFEAVTRVELNAPMEQRAIADDHASSPDANPDMEPENAPPARTLEDDWNDDIPF